MYDDLIVDFTDHEEDVKIDSLYIKNGKLIEYDDTTMKFYRALRERKLNVIIPTNDDFNSNKSFKIFTQWDPYTGEIGEIDPYGPLCFHPDDLIYFFYSKRLNMLWIEPVDEGVNGGHYEGYYADAMGNGEEIYITGRGYYPERYLFRLPIFNCYLEKGYDRSIITMGPKLTENEVKNIDNIAKKYYPYNYIKQYGKKRPSLFLMKKYYDQAISKNPDLHVIKEYVPNKKYTDKELNKFKTRANMIAIDMLRAL